MVENIIEKIVANLDIDAAIKRYPFEASREAVLVGLHKTRLACNFNSVTNEWVCYDVLSALETENLEYTDEFKIGNLI